MGDQDIRRVSRGEQVSFLRHLMRDIEALERMIADDMIEKGITRIGAEQEFCLVGHDLRPSMLGPKMLAGITDEHFTSELACWNLEINLDPQDAGPECFSKMSHQLTRLLRMAKEQAASVDSHVVLTGILPTIRKSELDFKFMTPNPRYHVLAEMLKKLRGEDFSLHIEGVDEINVKHDSILFEACNTSFQVHLQIDPDEFVDRYNWAQILAGPVLAACVNSPVLLGRELWAETRIALFRQSIEVHSAGNYNHDRQPRVAFGDDWLTHSAAEIFKREIADYRLIVSADLKDEDSLELLEQGNVPYLRAMNLHNGTVYKWNRACYGVSDSARAHLRIENRYMPAGPTPRDEMANAAFWIGLMLAMPEKGCGNWHHHFDFQDVRSNFLKAAQHGLGIEVRWFGKSVAAHKLVLDTLLPMARSGLEKIGLAPDEIDYYLNTILERVSKRQTGADWIIKSLRSINRSQSIDESVLLITEHMREHCLSDKPVHQWTLPKTGKLHFIPDRYARVDSIMVSSIITINEFDLLSFASELMNWHQFHHLPVEDSQGKIKGIVSARDIPEKSVLDSQSDLLVADRMTTDIIWTTPEMSLLEAERMMIQNNFGSLPVVDEGRVIGIITASDIERLREKCGGEIT